MPLTITARDILRQRREEVAAVVQEHREQQARHEELARGHAEQVRLGSETLAELDADLSADARARGAHTPV